MKRRLYLLIGVLTLVWSFPFARPRAAYLPPAMDKKVPYLGQFERLYQLHQNLIRYIDEYDENEESSDPARWSHRRSLTEAYLLIDSLLLERKTLARYSNKDLLYQLQVRRASSLLYDRGRSGNTLYSMVVEAAQTFHKHAQNDRDHVEQARQIQQLLEREQQAAIKIKQSSLALYILEYFLSNDDDDRERIKEAIPDFTLTPEGIVVEMLLLQHSDVEQMRALRNKISYNTTQYDQEWSKLYFNLQKEVAALIRKAEGNPYRDRIHQAKSWIEPQVSFSEQSYDAATGKREINILAFTSCPLTVSRSYDREQNQHKRHFSKITTLPASPTAIIRHHLQEQHRKVGYYRYRAVVSDSNHSFDSPIYTHSLINFTLQYVHHKAYLLARRTSDGAPVSGVHATVTREDKKVSEVVPLTFTTDAQGIAIIPMQRHMQMVKIQHNDLANGKWQSYIYPYQPREHRSYTEHELHFYTDRPIYRFGQKMQVGLIAVRNHNGTLQTMPEVQTKVSLIAYLDGKKVTLDTQETTSNSNGVAELSFTLPTNEKYDNFYLEGIGGKRYHGSTYLQVEAYKLNHLQITLDSIPSGAVYDHPMTLHGRVTDLNGLPVQAIVALTPSYPIIKRQEISTQPDGSFVFRTETLQDEKHSNGRSLHITLEATDPLGNIAMTERWLSIYDTDLPLDAYSLIPTGHHRKEAFKLSTSSQPYLHNPLGSYDRFTILASLTSKDGKQTDLGELPIKGDKTFNLSKLKSGSYTLTISGKDSYGKLQKSTKEILLYSEDDKQVPDARPYWCQPYHSNTSTSDYQIQLGSGSRATFTLLLIHNDAPRRKVHQETFVVHNEIRTYRISRKLLGNSATTLFVTTMVNGEEHSETFSIPSPGSETSSVKITGFKEQEQAHPAAKMHRKLCVLDSKGYPLRHAPVFVTVFDKAVLEASGDEEHWRMIYNRPLHNFDEAITYSAAPVASIQMSLNAVNNNALGAPRHMRAMAKGESMETSVLPSLRSNFVETAYFNALVTTDSKGYITYDYKLPDTQTSYLELVYVFNNDFTLQDMQKHEYKVYAPLSVEVNMPRYLLQGDQLKGVLLLRNTETEAIEATCTLTIDSIQTLTQRVTIPAQGTTEIPFDAHTHSTTGEMKVQAHLISPIYSDAIERTVQVQPAVSEYMVGVPFSHYCTRSFVLTLPKLEHLSSQPTFEAYLSPLHLLFTHLAHQYRHDRRRIISEESLYGLLHRFVAYSSIRDFLRIHPEVRQELQRSATELRALNPKQPLSLDQQYYIRPFLDRQADPHTLADYYEFVTQDNKLDKVIGQLEQEILKYQLASGAFAYHPLSTSPYTSLYVLSMLGDVPKQQRTIALNKAIQKALIFVDKAFLDKEWHIDPIYYALISSRLRSFAQETSAEVMKKMRSGYNEAAQNYREMWLSRLFLFGEVAPLLGTKKQNAEVQRFINDMSSHTFSDREQVLFALYKERLASQESQTLSPEIVQFMLKHKQGTMWDDPLYLPIIQRLLTSLAPMQIKEGASITLGDTKYLLSPLERATGHLRRHLPSSDQASISVTLSPEIESDFIFGGAHYLVAQPMREVTPTGNDLQVHKEIYTRRISANGGSELVPVTLSSPALKGEKIIVRYTLTATRDLSLVQIIDARAAGAEPGYELRGYSGSDRFWWQFLRRNDHDIMVIDYLPRGKHVIQIEATAAHAGEFTYGPAQISSYYAPEFTGNSSGGALTIAPRTQQ